MRKSSQGGFRLSQAMRMDSEDRRGSTNRRTLDKRGSGIPQPSFTGRGRRSSSENRLGRPSHVQPVMKRSRSQVSITATPLHLTPAMAFGSAASQKFQSPFSDGGRSSRKSSYLAGKPNRVVKDTRPLTEKAFQQQEIQTITSFFNSQPNVLSFAPKGVNLRQPLTMKLFVELVNFLFEFLDENISVTVNNYVTEIPLIMKRWGYVGNVNASWLKTVNTQHALPHVLGLLSWLVTLVSGCVMTNYDEVIQEAIQTDDDTPDESFPHGNASVYLDHLLTQYRNWNVNDVASEQAEETRFITDLCNRNGVSDYEMAQMQEAVNTLEMQLNDPKALAEIEAVEADEKRYNLVLKDYSNTLAYKNQMEECLNTAETKLEEEKIKLQTEETVRRKHQEKILNLKEMISKQTMTVEERDELIKLCSELNNEIRLHEDLVEALSNKIFQDDLDLSKVRALLSKKTQAFNKIIVMESSWLPELTALKNETNPLHPEAKEDRARLDAEACKLRDSFKNKHSDLLSKLRETKTDLLKKEEGKRELQEDVKQLSVKRQQAEQALEALRTQSNEEAAMMRKQIDSLKQYNEAHLNNSTLEDAKAELQKLRTRRCELMNHIEDTKVKAAHFFRETVRISQNYMRAVKQAEAAYFEKANEAVKLARDKLRKSQEGSDDLPKQ